LKLRNSPEQFCVESTKTIVGKLSPAFLSDVGDAQKSARAVPEPHDVNALLVAPQPVNDAIRTANDFPQVRLLKFRHRAADSGKFARFSARVINS